MTTKGTTKSTKKGLYWTATGLSALALAGIGAADLGRAPQMVEGLAHLGYPAYFASILGAWKVGGALVLLTPGLPRLKEWAYAGIFFTLTGAAASHLASGDSLSHALAPLVLLSLVLTSWALRPAVVEGATSPGVARQADAHAS